MITWNRIFFQSPSRYLLELVVLIHDYVIIILTSVFILVRVLIIFSIFCKFFRFEFYEDHQLEVVWTLIPFFLLVFIAFPSLLSLYMLDSCMFCGLTVTIMGHQWYWSYYYKEFNDFSFDSYMLVGEDNNVRLLDVDNRLVIPTSFPVRFLVRSSDVIHSWTVPSFGVKIDAVPGRINQFCFTSKRSGIFFGQCSEICGSNHSFIPIVIESLNFKDFISII